MLRARTMARPNQELLKQQEDVFENQLRCVPAAHRRYLRIHVYFPHEMKSSHNSEFL